LNDSQQALQVGNDIYQTTYRLGLSYAPEGIPLISLALPLAIIGGGIDFLVNFFEDYL
jgi:hypothetical protein